MKNEISKKELREFGLILGFCFPIIIGWLVPLLFGHIFRIWTLFIGLPNILMALFFPRFLYFPYKIWMSLGNILGIINGKIILGLVFILVVQPIALIMKLIGYDPLKRKFTRSASYREKRQSDKIDFNKIF